MNKLYKNTMDKINLPQEKKTQLEQLFHNQKSSGRKYFFKPAIATALCVALIVTIGFTSGMLGNKNINGFQILVNAKVAVSGDTEFTNDTICGMGESLSDNDISFDVDFPLTCKGYNMKNVSYEVTGGYFQVSYPENGESIVKGKEVKPNFFISNETSFVANSKTKVYKKINLDYEKQFDGKTSIQIVSNIKLLPEKQQKNVKKIVESENFNDDIEQFDKIFADNIQVKCVVTLKDGKTKTKKLKIKVEKKLLSEINKDMEVEKDGEVVYAVYCLKNK